MTSFNRLFLLLPVTALALSACDGRRQKSSDSEATFLVPSVELKKASQVSVDAFGLPEKKVFQFGACITDAVSKAPIINSNFAVSDSEKEMTSRTDAAGCLLWQETHIISSLQKEKLLRLKRTFRALEAHTGQVTVELAFNPWDDSVSDLRYFTPPELQADAEVLSFDSNLKVMLAQKSKASGVVGLGTETFLSDVSMEFRGHDKTQTQINSRLTLKPAQKFLLRLQPQFLRRNLHNEVTRVDVKGGEFKVRIVVLTEKSGLKPTVNDLVAESGEVVGMRQDGSFTKEILLRVHDTAALLSRNQVIVMVEAVGDSGRLAETGLAIGTISPLKGNSAEIKLQTVSAEAKPALKAALDSILEEVKKDVKPIDLLEKESGLARETQHADALLKLFEQKPTAQALKALQRSYCERLFTADQVVTRSSTLWKDSWMGDFFGGAIDWIFSVDESTYQDHLLDSCLSSPTKYVRIEGREFVDQLTAAPVHVDGSTSLKSININRSLRYAKSESNTQGTEFSYRFGASAEGSAGANFSAAAENSPLNASAGVSVKASIGQDWFNVTSFNRSKESSTSIEESEAQSLSVVADSYQIQANVRRCILVGNVITTKGFFACENKVSPKSFRETYYLINHGISSSPFSDEEAASNTNWRMTIRGTDSYRSFVKLMTTENVVLQFNKVWSRPVTSGDLQLPDFKVTQPFPGVLSISN